MTKTFADVSMGPPWEKRLALARGLPPPPWACLAVFMKWDVASWAPALEAEVTNRTMAADSARQAWTVRRIRVFSSLSWLC
jgi:hypothetical protein